MGRDSTGAVTNEAARRIELSYLIKNNFLTKGQAKYFTLSWTGGSNIGVEGYWLDKRKELILYYTHTDRHGEKTEYRYSVPIVTVPSNLGIGEVPYMRCPVSGKQCRILYCAYGSHFYKCREAYQNRIYYVGQKSAKSFLPSDKYWQLIRSTRFKELEKRLDKKYSKTHYNGKYTAWFRTYLDLKNRIWELQIEKDIEFDRKIRSMYSNFWN